MSDEKRCGTCCNFQRYKDMTGRGRCGITLAVLREEWGFGCHVHNIDPEKMKAELERLKMSSDKFTQCPACGRERHEGHDADCVYRLTRVVEVQLD